VFVAVTTTLRNSHIAFNGKAWSYLWIFKSVPRDIHIVWRSSLNPISLIQGLNVPVCY